MSQESVESVEQLATQLEEVILDENGQPLSKSALKKRKKDLEKQLKREKDEATKAAKLAAEEAEDYAKDKYGKLPLNQSQTRSGVKRVKFSDIGSTVQEGQLVQLKARLQNTRSKSAAQCFIILRQQIHTMQAILMVDKDKQLVSKPMIKFANKVKLESIVQVHGIVVKAFQEVSGCTVSQYEIQVTKFFVESEVAAERMPFTIENAQRLDAEPEDFSHPEQADVEQQQDADASGYSRVLLNTRLNNRVIDLRTTTNHAIFRIQHGVGKLFRELLIAEGFTEIHTPKIISAASEGGANVFKVSYFKTDAYLAQSPQLYKQMMICADFEKVFEIAPVFRAENSFTHRHMTEFVGADMEMAFDEHYHEVLDVFDKLFVSIFKGLRDEFATEVAQVKLQYPHDEFLFLEPSLRLEFKDAVKMLREAGVEIGDFEDLNTEKERVLGKLVRDQYKTDFFMLDKFPLAVRPFYTMPDPVNPNYSNSYDFFMRGEEIMSGAQRIHDVELLTQRALEHKVELKTIQAYLDAFKYGVSPHGGGGIGLERVVMLYLDLKNIRRSSAFPRDPRRLEP